jgi:glycogen(starch) synthase
MAGAGASVHPRMRRPAIAFASHELWPFVAGGGIGRSVWAAATLLRDHADVTVITSAGSEPAFRALPADDPRALPGVRVQFAADPAGDLAPLRSFHQAWSLELLEALRRAYPEGGPDLVEFNDYWGEGAMTVEARRSGDPFLRSTTVAVRTRTTHEITAALNGGLLGVLERTMHGLERCALRGADTILWPGGDVWGTYERFYGAEALAPARLIPETFMPAPEDPADRTPPPTSTLRLLYFGRLERRKGVQDLVQALIDLDDDDVSLTLVGGDTDTGPGGLSMRGHLKDLAAGDARIAFRERVSHEELRTIIRAHHVVVSASRWESWSNVVREALGGNRPVLATPVGGVLAAIQPGRSGWLTGGASAQDLGLAIDELRARRDEIARLISEGTPRACLDAMLGHDGIVSDMLDLAHSHRVARRAAAVLRQPVTALVAWDGNRHDLERALSWLRSSTVPLRVVLASAAGLPPARLGLELADAVIVDEGRSVQDALRVALRHVRGDALLLLDSRDELADGFLPRALAALAADPALAYVGALPARSGPPSPLPNAAAPALGEGIGSGPVLIRLTDLRSVGLPDRPHGDAVAAMAVALAVRGRWGTVIPEPLVSRSRARAPLPSDESIPARVLPAAMWLAPAAARS